MLVLLIGLLLCHCGLGACRCSLRGWVGVVVPAGVGERACASPARVPPQQPSGGKSGRLSGGASSSPIAQVQQNQAAAPVLAREYAAQEYTKISSTNLVTTVCVPAAAGARGVWFGGCSLLPPRAAAAGQVPAAPRAAPGRAQDLPDHRPGRDAGAQLLQGGWPPCAADGPLTPPPPCAQPISNADFVVPVEIDGTVHQVYVLKRPYVDEFLQRVGDAYECVLFTASLAKVRARSRPWARSAGVSLCSMRTPWPTCWTSGESSGHGYFASPASSTGETMSRYVRPGQELRDVPFAP